MPAAEPLPVAAVGSADLEAAAVYASCLCVTTFMILATSMNLGWVNLRRIAYSSDLWIRLANWK